MSRTFLAAALSLVWLLNLPTLADGGFVPPKDYSGEDLKEPCQRAIVVHRERKESLVLLVDYEGGAKEFAWIIPTPTKPEVQVADPALFQEIARYYHSRQMAAYREEMRDRARQANGLMGGMGAVGPAEERVKVYAQKLVGPYETAVLSATGEHALLDWLSAHGFRVGTGSAPVLAQYVKENWYFVAAKVRTSANSRQSLPPLRLDFAAEKPVYPLRISSMNRGVSEIRLYLLQGMGAPPELGKGPLRQSYRVHPDFAELCPRAATAFPGFADGKAVLSRVVDQFPSQVMAHSDDRLHTGDPARGERSVAFMPYCCVAKTIGIAEALLSADAGEREWAEEHLFYYANIVPRAGRSDMPAAQLQALRDLPQERRDGLKRRLLAFLAEQSVPAARRRELRQSNRAGAMVLLARVVRADDAEAIDCLETLGKTERGPQTSTDQLHYLGSPPSRRALFRAATARVGLSRGSAFRYVYSLEENEVKAQERRLACGELWYLLSEGAAVGDAKRRGLKLLKAYSGQDFGTDWGAWEAWLKANRPDYWKQKEPGP